MEALRDSCSPRPCPLPTPTLLGIRAGIPKWSQSSTAGFHSGRTGRAVFILNHATAQGKRSAGPDLHYPWQARGACAWLPAWVTLSLHWGLTLTHWPPHSASKVSPLCVDEALTVAPRAQPSGPLPASPASSLPDFPIPALRPLSAAPRPKLVLSGPAVLCARNT